MITPNTNDYLKINNYPISNYIKDKDWLVFSYEGPDSCIFLKTVFLALHVKNQIPESESIKIAISCHNMFSNWIPNPIFNAKMNHIENPLAKFNLYSNINNSDKRISTNHIDILNQLKIPYPLDLSWFFKENQDNNGEILISCGGNIKTALSESCEKDLYEFLNKENKCRILALPGSYYSNYWAKDIIYYVSNINEALKLISSCKTVIATDNFWLNLANVFPYKNVIGIFGPTLPDSSLYRNSMKIIQFKDNYPINDKRVIKSCPCIDSKFCHRDRKQLDIPFCLEKIDSSSLIRTIKNLIY